MCVCVCVCVCACACVDGKPLVWTDPALADADADHHDHGPSAADSFLEPILALARVRARDPDPDPDSKDSSSSSITPPAQPPFALTQQQVQAIAQSPARASQLAHALYTQWTRLAHQPRQSLLALLLTRQPLPLFHAILRTHHPHQHQHQHQHQDEKHQPLLQIASPEPHLPHTPTHLLATDILPAILDLKDNHTTNNNNNNNNQQHLQRNAFIAFLLSACYHYEPPSPVPTRAVRTDPPLYHLLGIACPFADIHTPTCDSLQPIRTHYPMSEPSAFAFLRAIEACPRALPHDTHAALLQTIVHLLTATTIPWPTHVLRVLRKTLYHILAVLAATSIDDRLFAILLPCFLAQDPNHPLFDAHSLVFALEPSAFLRFCLRNASHTQDNHLHLHAAQHILDVHLQDKPLPFAFRATTYSMPLTPLDLPSALFLLERLLALSQEWPLLLTLQTTHNTSPFHALRFHLFHAAQQQQHQQQHYKQQQWTLLLHSLQQAFAALDARNILHRAETTLNLLPESALHQLLQHTPTRAQLLRYWTNQVDSTTPTDSPDDRLHRAIPPSHDSLPLFLFHRSNRCLRIVLSELTALHHTRAQPDLTDLEPDLAHQLLLHMANALIQLFTTRAALKAFARLIEQHSHDHDHHDHDDDNVPYEHLPDQQLLQELTVYMPSSSSTPPPDTLIGCWPYIRLPRSARDRAAIARLARAFHLLLSSYSFAAHFLPRLFGESHHSYAPSQVLALLRPVLPAPLETGLHLAHLTTRPAAASLDHFHARPHAHHTYTADADECRSCQDLAPQFHALPLHFFRACKDAATPYLAAVFHALTDHDHNHNHSNDSVNDKDTDHALTLPEDVVLHVLFPTLCGFPYA